MKESKPVQQDARQLLECLLAELPHVQVLKVKWSMVRSKLLQLQTQLAVVTSLPASTSDPLAVELLSSISGTLVEAASLASSCRFQEYIDGGKLKVQSEVDAVLARMDMHARECEILMESGVLQDLSPSPATASQSDSVRAQLRKLIVRLQIGSPKSRSTALDLLMDLLNEDDKNATLGVSHGVVRALVRSFDTPEATREKIVSAIARVAAVEAGRVALLSEGLVLLNHLLRLLESGSSHAREKACETLLVLSSSKENVMLIGSRGGVCSLLEICHSGTPASQAYAAGVLRNVSVVDEVREHLVEESAVSVLVGLLRSGTPLAQQNSISCLCNLARDDEPLMVSVVREGGIACLRNFWDSDPSLKSLEVAADLVAVLAAKETISEMLVADGWVEAVSAVLGCGIVGLRIAAATALYHLSSFGAKTTKEMGQLGCITHLVAMLEGKTVAEREAAVKVLSVLVTSAGNRRLLRRDGRGIANVVNLLDPAIQDLDRTHPISVLLRLSDSKKCRKEMVDAGARIHLKKLAETDAGAKNLLAVIGQRKILRFFSKPS